MGASPTEKDRSSTEVDSVMDDAALSFGFLFSPSLNGFATERLEEPEVETVESEEDEGWEGCPRRAWFTWLGACCETWGCGDETDLFSWRSGGVVEKAYGAIGVGVPLYPVPLECPLYAWVRGICEPRCCW